MHIEIDGFEQWPGLRAELLKFVDEYCAYMTLAQAKEWYEEAFVGSQSGLNLP